MALDDLSREELREAVKARGIKFNGNPGKEKLVALLREHSLAQDEEVEKAVSAAVVEAATPAPADAGAAVSDSAPDPAGGATTPAPDPSQASREPGRHRSGDATCGACGRRHAEGQFKRCESCKTPL